MNDLAFLDCETTGLDPEKNEIIELAILRIDPKTLEEKELFHEYFFPTKPVAPEICAINGYSEKLWRERGAYTIDRNALERIFKILTDTTPVGQNPTFDLGFLKAIFKTWGSSSHISFPKIDYHVYDVATLAWPLVVAGLIPGVSLKHTRRYFELGGEEHRALGDVRATLGVYKILMGKYVHVWTPSIFEPELERDAEEKLSCAEEASYYMGLLRLGRDEEVRKDLENEYTRRRVYLGLGGDDSGASAIHVYESLNRRIKQTV